MMQKTSKSREHREEEEERTAQDQRNPQLDEDVASVLEAVACCLAEVAEEEDLAAKRAAKAEWDQLTSKWERQNWAMKYERLFQVAWCCDEPYPDFSGLE